MRSVFTLLSLAALAAVNLAAPITNSNGGTEYRTCNRPGVFALTFDDGPGRDSYDLAKYLHANGIKATFFTTGYNTVKESFDTAIVETEDGPKTYNEVLQYIDQVGHEVASHTYSHAVLSGKSAAEVEEELNLQSDVIFKAIGKRPIVMRPPEGATDAVSDKVIGSLGYVNVKWDVDTKDYMEQGLASEQGIIQAIVEHDEPGVTLGHISLQHDIHPASFNILNPWYIKYIQSKKYTFVTVSDCLGISAYR